MDNLRGYLMGILAAALVCALVLRFSDSKSLVGVSIKMVAGFLMLTAVLGPWLELETDGLFTWTDELSTDGSAFVSEGEKMAEDFYRDSIKQQLEAYILDEAKAYQCELSVEVILSDEVLATPRQIRLSGDIAPYARQALTNSLAEKLGLSREDLIWT